MTFKIGDKVKMSESGKKRWVNPPNNPVDEVGTVTSTFGYHLPIHVQWKSGSNSYDEKDLELVPEFKVGDKVKITNNTNGSVNKVGDVGIITDGPSHIGSFRVRVEGRDFLGNWTCTDDMILVETVEYEDQWHLNDGKVTIPDDADKLEKDGSVVAFRKRKLPEFKFGDKVTHKSTGNTLYLFISKFNDRECHVIAEGNIHLSSAFVDNLTKVV